MSISPCPMCGELKELGNSLRFKNEEGGIIITEPDIRCHCGLVLRPYVPLVNIGPYHTLLRPIGYHTDLKVLDTDLMDKLTNPEIERTLEKAIERKKAPK